MSNVYYNELYSEYKKQKVGVNMEYIASITSEMFPSCFLCKELKSSCDSGHTVAKLYLSPEFALEYYISFFENYSKDNRYYFVKQYLLDYLNDPSVVASYKANNIKYKKLGSNYRQMMINEITLNYGSHIPVVLENGLCEEFPGSYYIYSHSNVFEKLIKAIAIPEVTYLQIDKYKKDGEVFYFCFLRAT